MKLIDFLSEQLILEDLRATSRDGALQEIVGHIAATRAEVEPALAVRLLEERERLASTGVGNGFAIPHARLPQLRQLIGCVARSREGVQFASLDGRPVHLFLTLLSPEGGSPLHLKVLARASRLFRDGSFRSRMISAVDRAELWEILGAEDRRLGAHD